MEYRFECQRCLYCCSKEPGYVFLSKSDVKGLSSFFALSEEEFIDIYCRKIDYGFYYMVSLKEKDNYDCIFLSPSGCKVYPVRPHQCGTYPFWKGICDSEVSWKEEMTRCPGIGKGRVYSKKEIDELIRSSEESESYIIFKNH